MIDVSIVIPTYNRSSLLPRTLPALARQQTAGLLRYEVLFVDDGSTDGSRAVIERAAADYPGTFRYLALEHSGSPAGPRNHGIREASGRVILLVDDDVIPDDDLVLRHWEFHRDNPGAEQAALGELFLSPDTHRDPMSLFHSFPYDEVRRQENLGYLFFWTCNVSLKRETMLAHGMFDEDPALHPVEDMECGYRLFGNGLRLTFLPGARGEHVHHMQPEWVERKGLRTGQAQFALTLKVPDLGVKRRFGILDLSLPLPLLGWRALRRGAFSVVDNPLTRAILRRLGAEQDKRSRITDAYYYLVFRRSMLEGFGTARRAHGARARETDGMVTPEIP
jgi:glycosyltransferase involved in cell wall biosynthesis